MKLRVAVIGLRGIGPFHAQRVSELNCTELLALCDINHERLKQKSDEYDVPHSFTDYRELLALDALDCVVVATPHHLHHPIVVDALRAGKHVLCEKPLAIHATEANEMVEVAREMNLVLGCHYNQRLSPAISSLRAAVERGVLGDVYYVRARWITRWSGYWFNEETAWRLSKEKSGGGILIGRGSHLADAVWYVLGKPGVKSIQAFCHEGLVDGSKVDDLAVLNITFTNGCRLSMDCSYVMHLPETDERFEYEFYGTGAGAVVRFAPEPKGVIVGRCEWPDNEWSDLSSQVREAVADKESPRPVMDDFYLSVLEGRPPVAPGEEAAFITQIIETAYRSAETEQEIHLS